MTTILPVIHYADDAQAMRNADHAFGAGCEGVMLIEMQGMNHRLPPVAQLIKSHWPHKLVGVNFLNATSANELPIWLGLDMTWTDDQLTHSSGDSSMDAHAAARLVQCRPGHLLFCGVAFKYQPHEPNPSRAARQAIELGFIPTTSGPATGQAADHSAIAQLRIGIGPGAPLAIASGITVANSPAFLPLVSHALVSTGVSESYHEFDPWRLRDLIAVRDEVAR